MVDKIEARKYVADKIGKQHVVPILGVWNSFDEIEFDKLPESFVLKCNHDSGSYVIVTDKKRMDVNKARKRITNALKRNFYYNAKEWPYKDVRALVFAEKHVGYVKTDYRFFVFNGQVRFIEVFIDGVTNRRVNLYTPDWEYMAVCHQYPTDATYEVERPDKLEEMMNIAVKLAHGIPFLRVDLWIIGNNIYFNEFTFCPNAGFGSFDPVEYDTIFGEYLVLPNRRIEGAS